MGSDQIDPQAEPTTYASVAPTAQRPILVHAVIAGFTPLIPIPFVDEWARDGIQARMARQIAAAHDKLLYESDVHALGKESGPSGSVVYSAAKKLAFFPIKRLFRTALFMLVVKDIVEVASRTYHVGYLLDYAIGQGWHDRKSAQALRVAIDDICQEADTSPVRRAFGTVFEESKDLLAGAVTTMRGWVGSEQPADEEPREVGDLVDRLQRALQILPRDHFVSLRKALARGLETDTP